MKFSELLSLSILLSFTLLFNGCVGLPSSIGKPDNSERYNILRTLEDKILVLDTRSLYKKLSLVKKSLSEQSYSGQLESRTYRLRRKLNAKRNDLLECSHQHQAKKPDLALDCAYLAHKVAESGESKNNLNRVKKLIVDKARKSLATHKAGQKHTKSMARRGKPGLPVNFRASIDALNRLLALAPEDKEASQLLKELKLIQGKQIDELMVRGDSLYREQKVEKAIVVWEQAARLDANNKDISDRIVRARKVLGQVNKIKGLPKR